MRRYDNSEHQYIFLTPQDIHTVEDVKKQMVREVLRSADTGGRRGDCVSVVT